MSVFKIIKCEYHRLFKIVTLNLVSQRVRRTFLITIIQYVLHNG
jgi:hypothetical protein